jgi:FkbM family methyltransferase
MRVEFNKILFLPRALVDLALVLLKVKGPFRKRWMVCRFLFHLKWGKWVGSQTKFSGDRLGKQIFYLPNADDSQFLLKEIWKAEVYKPYVVFRNPPKLLDLGSNVGMFLSYIEYHLGLHPDSVAVEADAENMKWLTKNLSGRSVDLKHAVVSDFTGRGKVSTPKAGFLNRRFVVHDEGQELEFISILDLLEQEFDLVKIDIEGGEWKLIELLLKNPEYLLRNKYWMIEFHEEQLHHVLLQELERLFEKSGFKKRIIHSVRHYFREESFGRNK